MIKATKHTSLRVTFLVSLMFVISGVTGTAMGQSTATLQGTVIDAKGAVIPNAAVTVRNQATAVERTTQTDEAGNYQVAALPAGVYTIEVQASGFKRQVISDLNLEVARTVVKNFQPEIGSIEQTVSISADTPVIETTTTSVGQLLTSEPFRRSHSTGATSSILVY